MSSEMNGLRDIQPLVLSSAHQEPYSVPEFPQSAARPQTNNGSIGWESLNKSTMWLYGDSESRGELNRAGSLEGLEGLTDLEDLRNFETVEALASSGELEGFWGSLTASCIPPGPYIATPCDKMDSHIPLQFFKVG